MSFENASITWGANQLAAMVKNGKIVFDHIVQRSFCWERQRKSLFIHSLAIGIPIPPTYAKRYDGGEEGKKKKNIYSMLDGKQRFSTIAQFINNELVLSDLPEVTYYNQLEDKEETIDISHKSFSEIPEGLQEVIKNARISVVYFDNLTDEEEKELFKRLNNGKPLTAKNKALASCRNLDDLLQIGSHSLFEEMLTEKARDNKSQAIIIMKCFMMAFGSPDDISFESKTFNKELEDIEINDEEREKLNEIFYYIQNVHTILTDRVQKKIARKLYTETHFVSIIPCVQLAITNKVDEEGFADWFTKFFDSDDGASISDEYNAAVSGSVAKNINIKARNNALMNVFEPWLESYEPEEKEETNVNKQEWRYEISHPDMETVWETGFESEEDADQAMSQKLEELIDKMAEEHPEISDREIEESFDTDIRPEW